MKDYLCQHTGFLRRQRDTESLIIGEASPRTPRTRASTDAISTKQQSWYTLLRILVLPTCHESNLRLLPGRGLFMWVLPPSGLILATALRRIRAEPT